MSQAAKRLFKEAKQGHLPALAKLLSWLEISGPKAAYAIPELFES